MAMTVSGNEITDANRLSYATSIAAGQSSDGLSADSSYGMWESSTNDGLNGGFETNTTNWTAVSSTLTRITTAAKFGAACGNIVTSNATANEGAYLVFGGAAGARTASAWVLGAAGGTVQIGIQDNGIMRAVSTPVTLTGTWQRIKVSATTLTTTTPRVYIQTDVKQSITFQVDGVQCELKAFATPYIETVTVAQTRAYTRVQAPLSGLSEAQGWLAVRARYETGPTGTLQAFSYMTDAGGTSTILLYNDGANYRVQHSRNSVIGTYITVAGAPVAGATVTLVLVWNNTGGSGNGTISLSINGGAFTTVNRAASTGVAFTSPFDIGQASGTNYALDGEMMWFVGGTGRVVVADAATLSGYGNTDPTLAQLVALNGSTATPSLFWNADDVTNNKAGFDYGYKKRCVRSWYTGTNLIAYDDMTDNALNIVSGQHYVMSTEVELSGGVVFGPTIGLGGQAYKVGSKNDNPQTSPVSLDISGSHTAGYKSEIRQNYTAAGPFHPFFAAVPASGGSFHWAGKAEITSNGGGILGPPGGFATFVPSATFNFNTAGSTALGFIARIILGGLISYPTAAGLHYHAIDYNLCIVNGSTNFPDAYAGDAKVRANSIGALYGYTSVDAAGYSASWTNDAADHASSVSWQTIMTYLTTTADSINPGGYPNGNYAPAPTGGVWTAAQVWETNWAMEICVLGTDKDFHGILQISNMCNTF